MATIQLKQVEQNTTDPQYQLLINSKPTSVLYSYSRSNILQSEDPEKGILPKLLSLRSVDFPEGLEIWTYIKPTAQMPLIDTYIISRKKSKLTIMMELDFSERMMMKTKWNCVLFLNELVKTVVKRGWKKSKYWKQPLDMDDNQVSLFYITTTEKTLGDKINEAHEQLKDCLKEAEVSMQTLPTVAFWS